MQPDLVAGRDPLGRARLGPGDQGRAAAAGHHGRDLAGLKTPFRPHGRITAGNAAGLNDGATACLVAGADVAAELGLPAKMTLVGYGFAGVEPEVMGVGPIPATEKALRSTGLSIDDIGLFELNEAFAVQVLAFLDHYGIADDDPRVNPYGGAIAVGHPLASSGVRLMTQLAQQFERAPRGAVRPDRHVRRLRHGRHGHLGEPGLGGRGRDDGRQFPGEVVTRRPGPVRRGARAGRRWR